MPDNCANDKKERILSAAEEVFSRRGYIQATLDEIIKVADTGKGTVYKYYGSKENLFYTLVKKKHEQLMNKFWQIARAQEEPAHKIYKFLDAWVSFLMENSVLWQVMMFEMTGGSRGFTSYLDSRGEVQICAMWGSQPSSSQRAAIIRYHRLLGEESSPFEYVFLEAASKGFFKKEINIIDASRNLLFSVAMVVFHWKGVENVDLQHSRKRVLDITKYILYGIAAGLPDDPVPSAGSRH